MFNFFTRQFRLSFNDNPYFENEEIAEEFKSDESDPKTTEIKWKKLQLVLITNKLVFLSLSVLFSSMIFSAK